MRTSKPISTISYNSKEHLAGFLNKLVEAQKIAFWSAVKHTGETLDDGTREKDHWHVFVEPNVMVNSMDLQKLSCELDPNRPDKPLKCIDFRHSKWEDWVWYTLHDKEYLLTKVEVREFCYSKEDYIFSDEDEFDYRYERALHSGTIAGNLKIRKLMKSYTVTQLAAMGVISPKDAFHYAIYEKLVIQGEDQERLHLNELERIHGEQERLSKLDAPIEED